MTKAEGTAPAAVGGATTRDPEPVNVQDREGGSGAVGGRLSPTPVEFFNLFDEFRAESWTAWREKVLARITPIVRELFCALGRGSGKSRIAGGLATWAATARRYVLAPGERVYVVVIAPDRRQARVTFSYVVGLLHARPELEALIEREARESIELRNGVTIEVVTASTAAPRGRSYALVVIEEAAFLPAADSANPDVELLRAVRPALARVPGSLLVVVSSPYARRGILWEASRRASEQDGGGRVLFVKGSTLEFNPTFDAAAVEAALAEDPVGARAEYLAEFRSDVESFVTREAVEACVIPGRREVDRQDDVRYSAFVDPSGGRADSFTLAIGHHEDRDGASVAVVDAVRERRAPFSPEDVVAEFVGLLRAYGVRKVVGDRYAGEWPREAFRRYGVGYEPAPKAKSDLYRDSLALINARRVELPDDERLVTQLVSLERRTSRGGRDVIDHPPAGTDDLANAACGLMVGEALADRTPGLTGFNWPWRPPPGGRQGKVQHIDLEVARALRMR